MIEVAPSVLAADFAHLAQEVERAAQAGADFLHLDVMDGHFVPNISFGPRFIAAVHRSTSLPLEVHLMVYQPFDYIERCVESGAQRILFHLEATEDVEATLRYIRKCGCSSGLAINPETPVDMVYPYLSLCDQVLIMTVHPGFGGQALLPDALDKVEQLRATVEAAGLKSGEAPFRIEVDGGVDGDTVGACVRAGANILVSGSYLFGEQNMGERIARLRGAHDR